MVLTAAPHESQKKVNLKSSRVELSSNFLVTGSNILSPPFLILFVFCFRVLIIQKYFGFVTLLLGG